MGRRRTSTRNLQPLDGDATVLAESQNTLTLRAELLSLAGGAAKHGGAAKRAVRRTLGQKSFNVLADDFKSALKQEDIVAAADIAEHVSSSAVAVLKGAPVSALAMPANALRDAVPSAQAAMQETQQSEQASRLRRPRRAITYRSSKNAPSTRMPHVQVLHRASRVHATLRHVLPRLSPC